LRGTLQRRQRPVGSASAPSDHQNGGARGPHPKKASFRIVLTLDGICSRVRPEDQEKADSPIVVTLDGISSCLRPEQDGNAHSPNVLTLDGISSRFKPEHLEKADSPIVLTLDGICSCLKPEHRQKARSSIIVTLDGILRHAKCQPLRLFLRNFLANRTHCLPVPVDDSHRWTESVHFALWSLGTFSVTPGDCGNRQRSLHAVPLITTDANALQSP
jgi:hypothetical protein